MKDNDFFSEEEEEFAESLKRFLVKSHPNPERIGCPDTSVIRDIAFHRKVDLKTISKVVNHIMKCSECSMDALDYVAEYEEQKQTTEA